LWWGGGGGLGWGGVGGGGGVLGGVGGAFFFGWCFFCFCFFFGARWWVFWCGGFFGWSICCLFLLWLVWCVVVFFFFFFGFCCCCFFFSSVVGCSASSFSAFTGFLSLSFEPLLRDELVAYRESGESLSGFSLPTPPAPPLYHFLLPAFSVLGFMFVNPCVTGAYLSGSWWSPVFAWVVPAF